MKTETIECVQTGFDRPLVGDSAEPWETPYTRLQGEAHYGGITSYPESPSSWEKVPAGALESLKEYCGIRELGQVFIIPWAVRSTDMGDGKVVTPTSVLAMGSRAVGLWTDRPVPGMKAAIPLDELAAIEDVNVLLYGRLSFFSRTGRVTVRYNTVARDSLTPALFGLRRRIAGPEAAVPEQGGGGAVPLPFKWNNCVQSPLVRLHDGARVAYAFEEIPRISRSGYAQAHLLALNPRELVYLKNPYGFRYGVDSFIVPRSYISAVRGSGKRLEIVSRDAGFRLSVPSGLAEAAVRWLAGPAAN